MKLSLITINYNNAEGLRKTIESVLAQTFTDFEYIIVDGASTDGSLSILKDEVSKLTSPSGDGVSAFCETKDGDAISRCAENIEKGWRYTSEWLKIVSEPDKGIYNAMNKGIRMASGEYLLFLNSCDTLAERMTLEQVFAQEFTEDLVYGYQWDDIDGRRVEELCLDVPYITFDTLRNSHIPHQSLFIRREVFMQHELYREEYRIISDWAFEMLAIFKWNCTIRRIPTFVAVYDTQGISSDNDKVPQYTERRNFLEKEFRLFMPDYDRWDRLNKNFYMRVIHSLRDWKNKLIK